MAEAPAFHFESGDLVIGPFDPEEVKHNLFDPCTEISDAEFAAAGLVKSAEQLPPLSGEVNTVQYCALAVDDSYESAALAVNSVGMQSALAQSDRLDAFETEAVPEMYVFRPSTATEDSCYAAIDTARGALTSVAGSLVVGADETVTCPEAVGRLHDLLSAFGSDGRPLK